MGKPMFDEDCWKETLRELGWTGCRATDMDTFAERRGNLFVAETKPVEESIAYT